MKNIVLISQDRNDLTKAKRKKIVEDILSLGDCKIVLMVINATGDKNEYLSYDGVKNVITSLELELCDSMKWISYDEIIKCKEMKSDIENGAYRMYADYQMDKYYYYSALSFWLGFFYQYKIDVVIHTKEYHGFAYDCCDIVAKIRGVKSFHLIKTGYNGTLSIHHNNVLLPVLDGGCRNIERLLISPESENELLERNNIKKNIARKLLYKIGGNLLEDFASRMIRCDWKPRSIIRKKAAILWSEKFLGYIRLNNVKSYMNKLSIIPDYGRKYVCYFLHFEPEASMQVSTVLESQLVIIKMLSEALPPNWLLYVKEHPVQFDVNNDERYYHMYDSPLFKTKKFYKKINSISNVNIVDFSTKTNVLIEHSQAIASIVGTVLLEGVLAKKPVLAFSDLTPVSYMNDSFSIHSYNDVENALSKINSGFKPNYDDAEDIINKYVFTEDYMSENIQGLIRCKCQ